MQLGLLGKQGKYFGGVEVQRKRIVAMCQAKSMCLEGLVW